MTTRLAWGSLKLEAVPFHGVVSDDEAQVWTPAPECSCGNRRGESPPAFEVPPSAVQAVHSQPDDNGHGQRLRSRCTLAEAWRTPSCTRSQRGAIKGNAVRYQSPITPSATIRYRLYAVVEAADVSFAGAVRCGG